MDKLTWFKKISKFWKKWKKRPLCLLTIVILYCCQFIFFLSLSNALAKSGFKLRASSFKFNKTEGQEWKNGSRPISGYFTRLQYDTREKYYWNTVDNRDFLQLNLDNDTWMSSLLPMNTSTSTWSGKLIEAEKRWRLDREKDGEVVTFECPEMEKIGNREMCGFSLYTGKQQPEECIMMTFGGGQGGEVEGEFERRWLSETKCKLIMYEFDELGNEMRTKLTGIGDANNYHGLSNTNRLELFPKDLSNSTDRKKTNPKTLNVIMNKLGISWIDVLILQFKSGEGKEFSVLDQILKDFKYILPFAQLFVDFHFPNENCTGKNSSASPKLCSFEEKLVRRGLRPFHRITIKQGSQSEHGEATMTNQTETVVRNSFLNLKGKHLLLVGKDELA